MRKTLIMGNWKMFGSLSFVTQWIEGFSKTDKPSDCDFVVFPPFPYLDFFGKLCRDKGLQMGGQNCATHDQGAYTGEVSAAMLQDLGCQYVLIGHSERRHLYHETGLDLQRKIACAKLANLTPVFCMGETEQERAMGQTFEVLERQLDSILPNSGQGVILAYEPVWAIGTGKTANPDQVQEVHAYLRLALAGVSQDLANRTPILYGGSVKPDNAKALLTLPDVDGALIGGAALKPIDFIDISKASQCF